MLSHFFKHQPSTAHAPSADRTYAGPRATGATYVATQDEQVYQLGRARAAIKVLQEDLEQEKKDKPASYLNNFFSLGGSGSAVAASSSMAAVEGGTGAWVISSTYPGLCRDANTTSVFHVLLYAGGAATGPPLLAVLQPACPRRGEPVPIALSPHVLHAATLLTGSNRFCVSVRVEALNVPIDDVLRSHASKAAAALFGCHRLAMLGGLRQPAMQPSCAAVIAPALSLRAMSAPGQVANALILLVVPFLYCCLCTHTYTYIHTHIHKYIYIYVYTYSHVYIHTNTHTHTHTFATCVQDYAPL